MSTHIYGGPGSETYTLAPTTVATVAHPDSITFDPANGDMINLSKVDSNPASKAIDSWTLEGNGKFTGHAGQLILVQLDSHGDWALEGDTTGSGHANFMVDVHATGSQTAWVDVASHLIL